MHFRPFFHSFSSRYLFFFSRMAWNEKHLRNSKKISTLNAHHNAKFTRNGLWFFHKNSLTFSILCWATVQRHKIKMYTWGYIGDGRTLLIDFLSSLDDIKMKPIIFLSFFNLKNHKIADLWQDVIIIRILEDYPLAFLDQ